MRHREISIPSGAIKSLDKLVGKPPETRISIPSGAIKSERWLRSKYSEEKFQFLLVRLRVYC